MRSTHGCCAFNPTSGTAAPKSSLLFARTDEALGGPKEGQICMSEERGGRMLLCKESILPAPALWAVVAERGTLWRAPRWTRPRTRTRIRKGRRESQKGGTEQREGGVEGRVRQRLLITESEE